MSLQQVEDRMRNAKNSLVNLSADDDRTVEIVGDTFGALQGAMNWADELAREFADTENIN